MYYVCYVNVCTFMYVCICVLHMYVCELLSDMYVYTELYQKQV